MESSQDESIANQHAICSAGPPYHAAFPPSSVQQHPYGIHRPTRHSDRTDADDGENDSPPPTHLNTSNTASTATPTSSESTRSVTDSSDVPRQQGAAIPPSSAAPIGSWQAQSWCQSSSPFVPEDVPIGSNAAVIEGKEPFNEGVGEARYSGSPPAADQTDTEGRYSAAAYPNAIKILVSNNVAGSIIGRSGQTISDLQAQSSTRIKLSQAGDYYPGTQDRVCLVQGQADNVKRAVSMLLERLYALQQQQHIHHYAWQRQQQERGLMHDGMSIGVNPEAMHAAIVPGFSFVVRILVPMPCSGMIIGKGGSNVKHMVDSSGVSSVRLSPKEGSSEVAFPVASEIAAMVSATSERIVTVSGPDLNSCVKCVYIILDGMASHPDVSRYANMTTSYSRVVAAAQTAYAGSQSPAASGVSPSPIPQNFLGHDEPIRMERSPSQGWFDRQSFSSSPTPLGLGPPSPSHLRSTDIMPPYAAFGGQPAPFLPQDNILRSPLQPQPLQQLPGAGSPYMMHPGPAPFQGNSIGNEVHASHSAPDLLALQMQNSMRLTEMDPASASYPGAVSSFTHQIPQPSHSPPGFFAQVAIADNLIGSILGRGGRTLNELQVVSNTRIRISQRGEYVPGTKDRIVTIRGSNAHSVSTAQYLMSQRMVLPPSAATYMDRPDYGTTENFAPEADNQSRHQQPQS